MKVDKKLKIIGWLFIVGISAFIYSYFEYSSVSEFREHGLKTKGLVVACKPRMFGKGYVSTVKFQTNEGMECESIVDGLFKIGEEIDIFYLSDNPNLTYTKDITLSDYYVHSFILGGAFVFAAFIFLFASGLHHPPPTEKMIQKRIETTWQIIQSGNTKPPIFSSPSQQCKLFFDLNNLAINGYSLKSIWESDGYLGEPEVNNSFEGFDFYYYLDAGIVITKKKRKLVSIDACWQAEFMWDFNKNQQCKFRPYRGKLIINGKNVHLSRKCSLYEIMYLMGKPDEVMIIDENEWRTKYISKRRDCWLEVGFNRSGKLGVISACCQDVV